MLKKFALFLTFYIPFQVALNPAASIDLASLRILSILLFIFWVLQSLFLKKISIPVNQSAIFLYSFIFFTSFSIFFAENQSWSFRKMAFILSLLPIYFVFSSLLKSESFRLKTLQWLTFGAFISAIIGILQFLSQFVFGIEKVYTFWGKFMAPVFLGDAFAQSVLTHSSWLVNVSGKTFFRAISFFPDPHMFSFYMGMMTPIAFSVFLYTKKRFFLLSSITLLLADVLTFSRGGYMGLLIALVIAIPFLSKNTSLELKKSSRMLFYSLLVASLVFIATPIGERFLASFNPEEGSNAERLQLWEKSLQVSFKNPFGVGIGNLPLEMLPSASYRDPIYAHNLYLDISSEMGILALASFLLTVILAILRFSKMTKKNILYFGPLFSMIIFLSHSLVETPLYSVHVLAIFFILLSFYDEKPSKKNN